MKTNSRKDKLAQFNRENILDAADGLFRANGVEKTTMDMLAADAGCSKPTLYSYFKDKDEVFFALVYRFIKKVEEQLQKAADSKKDFMKRYMAVCNGVYELACNYPIYFEGFIGKINVDADTDSMPLVYKEIYAEGEAVNEILVKLIDEGKRDGLITADLLTVNVRQYLWGGISGIIRMALLKHDYLSLQKTSEKKFIKFCFERLLLGCVTV